MKPRAMSLKEYSRKRDFQTTAEPVPQRSAPRRRGERRFVIQKHAASHLHYDLRLEIGGAFKSWACPKGIPYAKGEKHLAVNVEDHPLAYGDFEGIIPQGEYGGGTVMLWDRGTFEPITPLKGLAEGKLHFILHGEKLEGEWYLVRLRHKEQDWLLIKGGESMKALGPRIDNRSVLSGKTMKQLGEQSAAPSSSPARRITEAARRIAGTATPKFFEPMKAKLTAHPPKTEEWLYEIKFDGWRALALLAGGEARLLSRNEKELGPKFPEIVEALSRLDVDDAVLDGEIVALDKAGRSSFQLLQAYEMGETRPPIYFYLFDLLQLNGRDMKALPIAERKEHLRKLLERAGTGGVLRFSASLGSDANLLLKKVARLKLEGLIGKQEGSRYEPGKRSGRWIKLKLLAEQEFVIGGYTEPQGARKRFGALLVGFYDENGEFRYAGKVGTGYDARWLERLHGLMQPLETPDPPFVGLPAPGRGRWNMGLSRAEMARCHWVKPELVCQVKFSEWTRDDRLRQPVFIGLRDDINPREVRRERST